MAALGGLLFGFDTAVIAGRHPRVDWRFSSLRPVMLGVTVSAALWGTVLGSIVAGAPSDRYGRSASLQALAVLYVVDRDRLRAGVGLVFVPVLRASWAAWRSADRA